MSGGAAAVLAMATLAVAPPARAQFDTQTRWFAFSPADDSFTVAMPSTPAATVRNGKDRGAPFTQRVWTAKGGGLMVIATVSDYRPSPGGPPQAEAVRDGVAGGLKGRILSSRPIAFPRETGPETPGLEFMFDTADMSCASDVYVEGYRVQAVVVCGRFAEDTAAAEMQVLQSFVLRGGGVATAPEANP